MAGVFVLLAALAALINWIVTTGGAGFAESPPGSSEARQRSLWDWMNLLLIPVVLGLGAFLFNLTLQRQQSRLAREENETDRDIGRERNWEETLRHFLDTMQDLVLNRGLEHRSDKRVRDIARARTLAAIRALSGSRERLDQVIVFLRESELLDVVTIDAGGAMQSTESPAITFVQADLRGVDLSGVDLSAVNLKGTDLSKANLQHAFFSGANLEDAFLTGSELQSAFFTAASFRGALLIGAKLQSAVLEGADLSGATLQDAENVTQEQLDSAFMNEDTVLPEIVGTNK